jgi:hypothetical protein
MEVDLSTMLNITAGEIGINKEKWESVPASCTKIKAQNKMKELRFDNLPIIGSNGTVIKFWKTTTDGVYKSIKEHNIDYIDTVKSDINFETLIDEFYKNNKNHFFIISNSEVIGLVTISDMNNKLSRLYLYSIISELEILLVEFINKELTELEILEYLTSKNKTEIIERYEKEKKYNIETSITNHLYFIDILKIIKLYELDKKLILFENNWIKYYTINNLRNDIMHSTNNIINSMNCVKKLKIRIAMINELLFKLKNINRKLIQS